MRPIRLHLDTSDYAAMYCAEPGSPAAHVRNELRELKENGRIEIGLSYHVVFELLQKAACKCDPGIVHDHVQAAESLPDLRNRGLPVLLERDIVLYEDRFAACTPDLTDDGPTLGLLQISHYNLSPLACQQKCSRFAQTQRAARHQSDFSRYSSYVVMTPPNFAILLSANDAPVVEPDMFSGMPSIAAGREPPGNYVQRQNRKFLGVTRDDHPHALSVS